MGVSTLSIIQNVIIITIAIACAGVYIFKSYKQLKVLKLQEQKEKEKIKQLKDKKS